MELEDCNYRTVHTTCLGMGVVLAVSKPKSTLADRGPRNAANKMLLGDYNNVLFLS